MKRRIVVLADLHCGARTGLTPPQWQSPSAQEHGKSSWCEIQDACWSWYASEIRSLGEVDLLIVNGDAIDGKGERSGGTEQITVDRAEQCEIAAECIQHVRMGKGGQIHLVRGTPYHVGQGEDWEDRLGAFVGAAGVGNHSYLTVHGVTLDIKHKVGSSTIPHGRHTPIAKERLWAQLWQDLHGAPKSQIILRSHTHAFSYCGGAGWVAIVTPALQSFGSKYGARQCSGTVDFGFVSIEIDDSGAYSWKPHLAYIPEMAPSELVVF